jgi:uncharacterized protein
MVRKGNKKRWQLYLKRFAIAYTLICTTLYFQQQRLMFFPSGKVDRDPSLYQLPYEEVNLPIAQTDQLNGWWIPSDQPNAPVLLYFHHNAVNIGANVSQALQFHRLGYSIFIFDYRGFGKSKGAFPTEPQLYEDAQTAWNYLTQTRKIPADRIIIYGHSVGGAIATDLASKHPEAAALVVQSSFTRMRDMTKRFGLYWIFPMELLLRQRFESEEKMKEITMPVLIITGTNDIQIPTAMGQRLHAAAKSSKKQLIIIPGGSHDNHLSEPHRQSMQQFLSPVLQTKKNP